MRRDRHQRKVYTLRRLSMAVDWVLVQISGSAELDPYKYGFVIG
jgi:hypothetical protein